MVSQNWRLPSRPMPPRPIFPNAIARPPSPNRLPNADSGRRRSIDAQTTCVARTTWTSPAPRSKSSSGRAPSSCIRGCGAPDRATDRAPTPLRPRTTTTRQPDGLLLWVPNAPWLRGDLALPSSLVVGDQRLQGRDQRSRRALRATRCPTVAGPPHGARRRDAGERGQAAGHCRAGGQARSANLAVTPIPQSHPKPTCGLLAVGDQGPAHDRAPTAERPRTRDRARPRPPRVGVARAGLVIGEASAVLRGRATFAPCGATRRNADERDRATDHHHAAGQARRTRR
jgi:hypothetical protein